MGNCGTYKWIPRVAKSAKAAPVGGLTGGIGAFGGFMIPLIFLGPAADSATEECLLTVCIKTGRQPAYGFFCFTAFSICIMVVNFFLQRKVIKEIDSPMPTFSADGES